MSEELKPCPFCGSTNLSLNNGRDFITCMDCGTEGPFNPGGGHDMAIEEWNSRADHIADSRKLVDEIRGNEDTCSVLIDGEAHEVSMPVAAELLRLNMLIQQRQDCEPVYQYQMGNGSWIDQTKTSYDYNVKHGQATVRVLYTAPPKREPLSDEQIKKAAAEELDSWGMALQEARRPVHEAITSMCWRLGVTL